MNNNTKEYGYIRVSSKTQNVARQMEILPRESHHSGVEWAGIPANINPLWFCLGAVYESGHILSSPCRHSGAIAGFIRCVQSHTLAVEKTIVNEVAHFTPDRWIN